VIAARAIAARRIERLTLSFSPPAPPGALWFWPMAPGARRRVATLAVALSIRASGNKGLGLAAALGALAAGTCRPLELVCGVITAVALDEAAHDLRPAP
jgi:hypothetical protein